MLIGIGAHAKVHAKPPTPIALCAQVLWHVVEAALAKLHDLRVAFPAMHVFVRRLALGIDLVFVHRHGHVLNRTWYDRII